MLLPLPALRRPLAQSFDFAILQGQSGICGRHAPRFIGGDAFDQFARGDDSARFSLAIQPQWNFLRDGIGSVAIPAFVGQNGPYIAVELDRWRGGPRRKDKRKSEQPMHGGFFYFTLLASIRTNW